MFIHQLSTFMESLLAKLPLGIEGQNNRADEIIFLLSGNKFHSQTLTIDLEEYRLGCGPFFLLDIHIFPVRRGSYG